MNKIINAVGFSYDGKIVCKDQENKVLFIDGLIPGEIAEIDENNTIVNIIKSSDERQIPKCNLFSTCGGCSYQHISIKEQRIQKINLIQHTLTNYFKLNIPQIVNLSESLPAYNYRNRIKLHKRNSKLGFYPPKSNQILEVKECCITKEQINNYLKDNNYFEEHEFGEVEISLFDSKLKHKFIEKSNKEFDVDFSQVNEDGNKILITKILELINNTQVTELYAGSGNFTIPLAKKGIEVCAIELNYNLTKIGKQTTKDLPIEWITSSVDKFLANDYLYKTVLLDPPREGCKNLHLAKTINKVKEIIYVSCNLTTLGRDLKNLILTGFRIDEIYFVDMFAQTKHLEIITKLTKI